MIVVSNPVYQSHINQNSSSDSRRLKVQEIDRILTSARNSLLQRVVVAQGCCGSSRVVSPFTHEDYLKVPTIKKIYINMVLPCVFLGCVATIWVTALVAKGEADGHIRHDNVAYSVLGLMGLTIVSCGYMIIFGKNSEHVRWTRHYYSKDAAEIIDRRVDIIDSYLQYIQGAEYAQPEKLAALIATVELTPSEERSLIAYASMEEYALMLQEFKRRKFNGFVMPDWYRFARILIENPPIQEARYRECMIRASPVLQTPDDYLFLKNRLKPDDLRQKYLRVRAVAEEDTSSYSSESADSVAIEIACVEPEVQTIYVEDVRILVDAETLHKESHWPWFNQSLSVVRSTYPYTKELAQILSNLKNISILWSPLIPENKDQYVHLFKALRFYQFSNQQHQLCLVLFNAPFMDIDEKLELVRLTIDVADDEIRSAWYEHIYTLVRNEDHLTYAAALAFEVKHFPEEIAIRYTEHMCSTATTFSGMKIKEVARFRNHFPRAMEALKRHLSVYLHHKFGRVDIFWNDPEILEWIGTEMLLPDSKLISTGNFRKLWPLAERNATIARALHRFASAHRSAVVGLWAAHEVPNELIEILPI